MLEYKIFDSIKDPQNILGAVVEYFTKERLANKALFESTGDQSYDHKQSGQKITINSMYGFLGAPGLNYNYPKGAAEVTSRGREILKKAVLWATGKEFTFDSDAYEFGGLDDQS
jgi:DNA polymerase elongation subunit (family B)